MVQYKFKNNNKLILLHAIIFLTVLLVSIISEIPTLTLIIGGALYAILSIIMIINEKSKSTLLITPITVFFTYVFFSYGLAAISTGIDLLKQNNIPFLISFVNSDAVEAGYIITILGTLFFHIGLEYFRPRKNVVEDSKIKLGNLIWLYLLGLLVLLSFYLPSFIGSFFTTAIKWIPLSVVTYIALAKPQKLNISITQKKSLVIILSILLFISQLFTLSKLALLMPFLPLFWMYLRESKHIWKLVILLIIPVILYLNFIQPYVGAARTYFGDTHLTKNISETPVSELTDFIIHGDFKKINYRYTQNQTGSELFFNRLFESVAVGYLYQQVEQNGLLYGSTLNYIAYGLVPRILWPNKPEVSRSGWFTRYIGVNWSTATGMTSFGELYWNFGYLGVICGMFFLGILYAGLWRLIGTEPHLSFLGIWLYIMLIYGMILHPEFGSELLGIIQMYILFFILFFPKIYSKHSKKKLILSV